MLFERLSISNWRQFSEVDIEFSSSVTILTGANGAGKSTLLRLLSQHFGWYSPFLGTPVQDRQGIFRYLYGVLRSRRGGYDHLGGNPIGEIRYSNRSISRLIVPASDGVQFNVSVSNQQHVEGLFIPSHRPMPNYQPIDSIPTFNITAEQAYQSYFSELSQKYNNTYSQFSPTYRMKEAIISMATFGPGNESLVPNYESLRIFREFEDTLRVVMPTDIGFKKISVRMPDVVFETDSGDFVIDAASGGIMSLIDLAWQVFLYSQGKSEYVVVLDEPENHLHPSMQRTILSSMVKAFPTAQFIVATHSPFIVSSVKDARVYVLRHETPEAGFVSANSVSSILLDQVSKAGTASEILRAALGVPVTTAIWVEEELQRIATDFSIDDMTAESLNNLRQRLENSGLEDYYPEALREMAARR
ncbi:MAG: AAA family ATPase [Brevundimonas sp.]|uniref:AAA family ATPase n=1 Tax=Brevundimonas sp. TaxID=1871086 RepID=UPI00391913F1